MLPCRVLMDMMVALGPQAVLEAVERLEIKEELVTQVHLVVQEQLAHTDPLDLEYVNLDASQHIVTILIILCLYRQMYETLTIVR